MKKLIYLLPILALLLHSCSNKNELTGTLANSDNDGKQVFLLRLKDYNSSFEPADSTTITNGKFTFKLEETTEPQVAYVVIKEATPNTANGIPFVYENGKIELNIDSVSHLKGTPMNEKSQAFFDKLNAKAKEMMGIEKKIAIAPDEQTREQYFSQIASLNTDMASIGYDFIKENIKNKIGEFYLISMMGFFDEKQIDEILAEASPEYKKIIDEIRNMNNPLANKGSFIGKQFIDVSGTTPQGKSIALSDYVKKNKVVLIDFWASWCGPCIKEMPNVVAAYKEFKSKGFEIVGISLDEEKAAWTKSLTDMNMTWPQMSDLKGWESALSAPYQVSSIPFTLLVDQNGNIIAENLRGQALHDTLRELLN
ncbi:MAG: TlpA disulfide reductase family protein [Dysgonomonas sp.]|nr:TlpA disulfide reductase family protein [Dysgonomonas sp.]